MKLAEYRSLLRDTSTLGTRDVKRLFRARAALDEREFWDFMMDAYPAELEPHIADAADLATEYYAAAGGRGLTYRPVAAPPPPVDQLRASARWALLQADPFEALAGSAQRMVQGGARDTITLNVKREPGARWARYASFTACEFCRMAAIRGGVYRSEDAADSQYHDHCHCMAVCVRPGDEYEPPEYVQQWDDEYAEARKLAESGDTKKIMAAWRGIISGE